MTWFKVDDGLHSHDKALRAGVPAMGLWVLAGSWSADQLTDGWVPQHMVQRIDPKGWRASVQALVRVGLWQPTDRDGEPGWEFHEWSERQPSREQVLEERAAHAERQRRFRERMKERRRTNGASDAASNGVTGTVTRRVTAPSSDGPPVPSRPDPPPTEGEGRGRPPASPGGAVASNDPQNPDWRTLRAAGAAPEPADAERARRGAAAVRANIRRPGRSAQSDEETAQP